MDAIADALGWLLIVAVLVVVALDVVLRLGEWRSKRRARRVIDKAIAEHNAAHPDSPMSVSMFLHGKECEECEP